MEENKENQQQNNMDSMFSASAENDISMFSADIQDNSSIFADDILSQNPEEPENLSDNSQTEPIENSVPDSKEEQKKESKEEPKEENKEINNLKNESLEAELLNSVEEKEELKNDFDEILNNDSDKIQKKDGGVRFDDFDKPNENDPDALVTVRPVKFQHFKDSTVNFSMKKNLDIMQDILMHITVELGRTKSTIKEIINMDVGSIVELDKIAGEQVEIYVNEKLVARGEVIVIEDKFGVRVVSTNIPKEMN